MKVSECKSCHAEIYWGRTPRGRMMPLNREPEPEWKDGLWAIEPETINTVPARDDLGDEWTFHTPHFVTCPYADIHRRSPETGRSVFEGPGPGA